VTDSRQLRRRRTAGQLGGNALDARPRLCLNER
jgi:hypothetical protein